MARSFSRGDWGAAPPKRAGTPWPAGEPGSLTVHWVGDPLPLITDRRVPYGDVMRTIQRYHLNHPTEDYIDIAYNMAIDRYGNVYEGRGRNVRSGANGTSTANRVSAAVVLLTGPGDLNYTPAMLSALKVMAAGYHGLHVHKDWVGRGTVCPGPQITAAVRKITPGAAVPTTPSGEHPLVAIKRAVDAASRQVLRRGSKGPAVFWLQVLLNQRHAAGLRVDSDFGPDTERAVRDFQSDIKRFFGFSNKQMPVDGIAGPKTWYWLLAS